MVDCCISRGYLQVHDRATGLSAHLRREFPFMCLAFSAAACFRVTCKACGVCPHEFVCDCPDSLRNSWACKHAHLMAMLFGSRQSDEPAEQHQAAHEESTIDASLNATVAEQSALDVGTLTVAAVDAADDVGEDCALADDAEFAGGCGRIARLSDSIMALLHRPISASFDDQQRDGAIAAVS